MFFGKRIDAPLSPQFFCFFGSLFFFLQNCLRHTHLGPGRGGLTGCGVLGPSPSLSLSVTDGTGESGVTQGPVHKGRNQRSSELKSKRLEGALQKGQLRRDRRRWRRIRNLRQGVGRVARTCQSRKDRSKRWELMERWRSPRVTGVNGATGDDRPASKSMCR